jgi:hypothetical protein
VAGRHRAEVVGGRSPIAGRRMQRRALVGRRWAEEVGALTGGRATQGVGGSGAYRRGGVEQRRKGTRSSNAGSGARGRSAT